MFMLPDRDRHNTACVSHPKVPNEHGMLTRKCDCGDCLVCPSCVTHDVCVAVAVTSRNRAWQQKLPTCDHSRFVRIHGNWSVRSCHDCGSSSPDDGQTWRSSRFDADMPQRRAQRQRWLAERNSAVDADGRQCKASGVIRTADNHGC